jgi:methionine-S-sulfoxide reductase
MDDTDTKEDRRKATLAGGCFWCVETHYAGRDGVKDVVSGYAGGSESTATYREVATGQTDHREAVQITYDPTTISYEAILDTYWSIIDPTDDGGQFADRGHQYTTAIYYHDEEQRRVATASKQALERSDQYDDPIVTSIEPHTTFFKAEDSHQDYAEKHPRRYKQYERASGRADHIRQHSDDHTE